VSQSEEQAAGIAKRLAQAEVRRQAPQRSQKLVAPSLGAGEVIGDCAIVGREIQQLLQHDERVIVVSHLAGLRLSALRGAYGERFYEAGGELEDAVQWCSRKAGSGCHPVLLMSTEGLRRCFDRVCQELGGRHSAMTLVLCHDPPHSANGAVRSDALALRLLRLVDDVAIMIPADQDELRRMLELSTRQTGPTAVIVYRGLADGRGSGPAPFGLGQAKLVQEGTDVALVAVGPSVSAAQRAAERLADAGVSTAVVNARFVHPLDTELLLDSARRSRGLVIVEQGAGRGGFGSAVVELLAECSVATPVRVLEFEPKREDQPGCNGEDIETIVEHVHQIQRTTPGYSSDGNGNGRSSHVAASLHPSAHGPGQSPNVALSRDAQRWVHAYSRIGHRTNYLWHWCLKGLELTTLPCVLPALRCHVRDTKLLSVMLGVLLDDVADRPESSEFLEALVEVVSGTEGASVTGFSVRQQQYADLTRRLCDEFHDRAGQYPCYDVYAELLRYDNLQVWNTMRYAKLVNRHLYLLNLVEHDLYLTHNMQMMSFATLDLMCSPEFECTELGRVREAIWRAQCMARIGNLVSTWQREITEKDFTSAVFARAVLRGELTPGQLASGERREIEAAIRDGCHEEYFLRCWHEQRDCLWSMRPHIRSFDLAELVRGLDQLIEMELSSRGRK
jgi:transketolase C-terminal domain/subunit